MGALKQPSRGTDILNIGSELPKVSAPIFDSEIINHSVAAQEKDAWRPSFYD